MTATIVFDFDGTIAVGNGPVLAYARQVARYAGDGFLADVEQTLAAFDAGRDQRFRDGYDAVASLGSAAQLTLEQIQAAYLASRAALGGADSPVDVAPGLAGLLAQLPEGTRVVLATNAPRDGLLEILAVWGLDDAFDEVRDSVGKPAGLAPIIREALARGPVLSIGDIVENDLAPAAALGADTALVGATAATSPASVTMRATTLAELAPEILAWARAAASAGGGDAHVGSLTAASRGRRSATPAHPESAADER